jgi:hypothetical protein
MRFINPSLESKGDRDTYKAYVPPEPRMYEWPKWLIELAGEKFPEHRERLEHSWSAVLEELGAVHVEPFQGFEREQWLSTRGWLDHWGTASYMDHEVLVSEPYHLGPDSVRDLLRFCENLDLTFSIQAGSWHYPTLACRILVWRKGWNIPEWWQQRPYLYAGKEREQAKRRKRKEEEARKAAEVPSQTTLADDPLQH